MIFPWFVDAWSEMALLPERLPHALLFFGQAGIGKVAFATEVACSLLCEAPAPSRPDPAASPREAVGAACGRCASCLWFERGNHPDFRLVRPDALEQAEGRDPVGGEPDDAEPAETEAPAVAGASRGKRAPSKEIRIDQIRALHEFLGVGTHRGGNRIVLLYPLDRLNTMAANALLKMLEEPPPRTVFLLVADNIGRIAPTILSRCRKAPLRAPAFEIAVTWLASQGVTDPERLLAEQGGAPLAALEASRDATMVELRERLVAHFATPSVAAALAIAEAFAKVPASDVVGWMQRWLADCVTYRLAGRIRYHPNRREEIAALTQRAGLNALFALARRFDDERRHIDHPLNPRLLFESLLLAYAEATASPTSPDRR